MLFKDSQCRRYCVFISRWETDLRLFLFCFLNQLCDPRLDPCTSPSGITVSDLGQRGPRRVHPYTQHSRASGRVQQPLAPGLAALPTRLLPPPAVPAASLRGGFDYGDLSNYLRHFRLQSFLWTSGDKKQKRQRGPLFHVKCAPVLLPNMALFKPQGCTSLPADQAWGGAATDPEQLEGSSLPE